MLVIPGVTSPVKRPATTAKQASPQPSRPTAAAGATRRETGPAVAGPSDVGSPFRPGTGQPTGRTQGDPLQQPIPMTLEPLDDELESRPKTKTSTLPQGAADRSRAGGSRPAPKSRTVTPGDDSAASADRPAPKRLPGILGRLFQPLPPPPVRAQARSSASPAQKKADTSNEPVTDASVKRKIEKQIRETLGDRVRSVEVRVSGRNVLIVGQATRFWQKRAVRRSLETLSALDGYRARIELDD